MANEIIKKIKRGMIVRFPDGLIDIVVSTGYIGKSNKFPEQKGSHWLGTRNRCYYGWDFNKVTTEAPEILGYADKRDMKRINRINKLVKDDKRKGLI